MRAAEILGPGGVFARGLARYEAREGQQRMAECVEDCLKDGGISLIEAGTGTGKSFGYLVPALLAAGTQRIVISTSTRTLQDQLYVKDLPLAQKLLGTSVRTAVLKGLPNYVCRRRLQEFRSSSELLERRFAPSLSRVQSWLDQTSSGAFDEMSEVPEEDPVVARISSSSERRIGGGCEHFERCFVTRAKRQAAAADILVVNHHLFFADLAIRGSHSGSVLPDYDAVIFDEAHQLEEVATLYFGKSVSTGKLNRLATDGRQLLERGGQPSAVSLEMRLRKEAIAFFDSIQKHGGQAEVRQVLEEDTWLGNAQGCWFALDTALENLGIAVQQLADEGRDRGQTQAPGNEGVHSLARRIEGLRSELSTIVEGSNAAVCWLDVSAQARTIGASPVDVSQQLQARLFDVVPSIVLTSATLADRRVEQGVGEELPPPSAFEFHRARLGLTAERQAIVELVLNSPFDFEQQALLYLPRDLPFPGQSGFAEAFSDRSAKLIEQANGGAFVLTTSLKSMRAAHARLRSSHGATRLVLAQGQAPKAELLAQFRDSGNAVLVATLSFWQGVDVPGSALRLVILEKAPFPVPHEPLVQARSVLIERQGESAFARLHLPQALLTLKQGFGRLIRTRQDFGVVALLDARVHARGYGKRLLDGLPNARRAATLPEVESFWKERSAN